MTRFVHVLLIAFSVIAALLMVQTETAMAHFTEGTKTRILLLTPDGLGGLKLHVRTPAPLLFADAIAAAEANQTPIDDPLIYFVETEENPLFFLFLAGIESDPPEFVDRFERAFELTQDGTALAVRLENFRIHSEEPADRFYDAATGTLLTPITEPIGAPLGDIDPVFDNVVIDATFTVFEAGEGPVMVRSILPALSLPEEVTIDNHLIDARGQPPILTTAIGELIEPVTLLSSQAAVFAAFIYQGILHIIEGLDHLLLVVIIGLSAVSVLALVGRVTAFTLGHSVTLIAAFLGFVPSGDWFIPAIESLIAATIIAAALTALARRQTSAWALLSIGLVHGFGFAFVLANILDPSAPQLVPALAAFNIGIEIGQLLILAATLAVAWLCMKFLANISFYLRQTCLVLIALLGSYWLVERVIGLADVL